jgi:methylenetetrahydrofolate reductase (NADH)
VSPARDSMPDVPSRLAGILGSGGFAVTAEVVPPVSAGGASVEHHARELVGYVDAANVTDNPTGSAHMSAVAGAAFLSRAGVEPILQLTCRDRNRLALSSELLGAWALGARNLLCLSGDRIAGGDHPEAAEVRDLSVLDLVRLATGLRDQGRLLSGTQVDDPPRYLVGVADAPLAEPYDPARLEAKLDAGANFVQTQIAYDLEGLQAWAEVVGARGIFERAAVLVGVTPLRSAKAARFVDEQLFGVRVPPDVIRALDEAGPQAESVGMRMAIDLVERLRHIPGLAGVHLMTLGRDDIVQRVVEGAGLFPRPPSTWS